MSGLPSLSTLLVLSDSRLPTGGHVHSGGVEEAITSSLVVDLPTLRRLIEALQQQEQLALSRGRTPSQEH